MSTTSEQIMRLGENLTSYISSDHREFLPSLGYHIGEIGNNNRIKMNIELPHKGNW